MIIGSPASRKNSYLCRHQLLNAASEIATLLAKFAYTKNLSAISSLFEEPKDTKIKCQTLFFFSIETTSEHYGLALTPPACKAERSEMLVTSPCQIKEWHLKSKPGTFTHFWSGRLLLFTLGKRGPPPPPRLPLLYFFRDSLK